jgi:hypothetical protein
VGLTVTSAIGPARVEVGILHDSFVKLRNR